MKKVYCKNCECWDNKPTHYSKTDNVGYCKLNPPGPGEAPHMLGRFPKTQESEYCFSGIEKQIDQPQFLTESIDKEKQGLVQELVTQFSKIKDKKLGVE